MWHVKKNGMQAIGKSCGGLTTKIHMVVADCKTAIDFMLSAGNLHDAPQGRILLETIGRQQKITPLIMDCPYVYGLSIRR